MSKKYDEYINESLNSINNDFPPQQIIPMIPNIDKDLEREIRDRLIIELVKKAISEGKELTYGDIRLLIDDDPSEKEYENEQLNHHTR
jgi:hypothetical protein